MIEMEGFREPTARERDLVGFLLTAHRPALPAYLDHRERMMEALPTMRVATNCICGCGSFTIVIDGPSPEAPGLGFGPVAWDPERAIEAQLSFTDGIMHAVEITYYASASAGVPDISTLELDLPDDRLNS